MPTPNNMAVRPSSDMSDSYSDFESAEGDEGEEGVMDEDDVQDEQDSDDDSDDDVEDEEDDDDDEDDEDSEDDSDEDDEENSSVRFVVPSLLKSGNAAKAISETKRSVVSNGVAKTSANKKADSIRSTRMKKILSISTEAKKAKTKAFRQAETM